MAQEEEVKKILEAWRDTGKSYVSDTEFPSIACEIAKLFSPPPVVGDLRETQVAIAKWLFKNRHRLPNQRFYHDWLDEIEASPLTEKEYLNLANEVLALFRAIQEAVK